MHLPYFFMIADWTMGSCVDMLRLDPPADIGHRRRPLVVTRHTVLVSVPSVTLWERGCVQDASLPRHDSI